MLRLIHPGLQSTVQDLGRKGYQADGVPEAGAVDPVALQVGNRLVGNPDTAAGVEMALLGATFQAERPLVVALTGADMGPMVGDAPVPMWEAFRLSAFDTLRFSGLRAGCRCYLTVAGGIDVDPVLGSRSTDLLGKLGPPPLAAGAVLPVGADRLPDHALVGRRLPAALRPEYGTEVEVRVVPGPQDDMFPAEALDILTGSAYTINQRSDRMGCRLDGPALPHRKGADIISDGMPLGGIQIPPDGKPILLLQGRQTMGGYAKIGVAVSPDVARIGQVVPGGKVRFRLVTREQAHLIYRVWSDDLALMLSDCSYLPERLPGWSGT